MKNVSDAAGSTGVLTADVHALVQAIAAVVVAIAEPLPGDALVFGARKLIPRAGGIYERTEL